MLSPAEQIIKLVSPQLNRQLHVILSERILICLTFSKKDSFLALFTKLLEIGRQN